MTTTPSSIFGLSLQGDGDNLNTWGQVLNALFEQIEQAIASFQALTVNDGVDVTLDNSNFVANESRRAGFIITGTGNANVICAAGKPRKYLVKNDASDAVTFTHSAGGTDIEVAAGEIKWIFTDGTDFFTAEEKDYLLLTGGTLSGLAKYNNDKSGSFDDRSLVDKEYADTKLAKSGGTMTGFITLHADATADMHPVTYQQLQATALGEAAVSFAWADVTGKPTTIAGYGITDAFKDNIQTAWRARP